MLIFAALIAAWVCLSLVVGIVLGRGVRLADEREGQTTTPVPRRVEPPIAA